MPEVGVRSTMSGTEVIIHTKFESVLPKIEWRMFNLQQSITKKKKKRSSIISLFQNMITMSILIFWHDSQVH